MPSSAALLVAVGRAGMNALHFLQDKLEIDTAYADTDHRAVHESKADMAILVRQQALTKFVDKGFEIDSEITFKEIEKIAHLLDPYDRIYLVGALGGSSGATLIPAIAKEAADLNKELHGHLILPFKMEERRRKIARFYLDEIRYLFTRVDVYDNSAYADRYEETHLDDVTSLQNIFDEVNRDILREIQEDELYVRGTARTR